MLHRSLLPISVLTTLAIFSLPVAQAAPYTITDLGTLPGGRSGATAINASGQVVGGSRTASGSYHAFLYANGVMQDLGTLGGTDSSAYGINASGQVVGWLRTVSGSYHSFLYANGVMQDLGTLGGTGSSAHGINASGQIVVSVDTAGGSLQAFLYTNGVVQDLGTLGGAWSAAQGINTSGQVVGGANTTSGSKHAFLYANGVMQDLGTLGGTDSSAYGINASGLIVGYAGTDSFAATTHPFLYANGVMTDLGALGDNCHTRATGINASGQIVGHVIKECSAMVPTGAFLYSDGKMVDLSSLLPANSGWTQLVANAINDFSQMVGYGTINGQTHAFLMSDSAITLIVHYYTSILGRTPDAGGLAFWRNQIIQAQASGQDVKRVFREMAVQFFNSPEYLANNTSNTQFITNLYGTFFQREPDSAGIAFWLNQLALGVTRDVVMGGFLYSTEFTTFMQSLGF